MSDSLLIQPVARPVDGDVRVPGSKSITNRALPIAALAAGTSRLEGALFSDDTRYMCEALRALGIEVRADADAETFEVDGQGGKLPAKNAELFIGNSGTSARFLTALLALGHGDYRLDGVEEMRRRPIGDLLDALNQLGVDARDELGSGCPPVVVRSQGLRGGRATMRAEKSSQPLSGLLLVAPLAENGIEITVEGELFSRPYIDITLRMMEQWGVTLQHENLLHFQIAGQQKYRAQNYVIEPDASGASYFWAAAAVTGGRVRVEGIGRDSLQGDAAFVDVLEQMGCAVERGEDYIEVRGVANLRGVDVDMNAISDTVMTLAAIAPFADGPTNIRNVAHIQHKESERISNTVRELQRLGVRVDERHDGMTIHPAEHLQAAQIETYRDHRMAMSFAITGLRAPGVTILDPGCVAKTFPDFFSRLDSLCQPARVRSA